MTNVNPISPASGELNSLLSLFNAETDRDSIELAMRSCASGGYQLMDKSPVLPERVSSHALNLGVRLGFCQISDRIGQTLFLRIVSPALATPIDGYPGPGGKGDKCSAL